MLLPLHSIYTVVFVPIKQENSLQILGFSRGTIKQRKPKVRGKINYYYKQISMWRPRRIYWEEKGKWKAYPPKNSIQELLRKVKFIILDNNLSDDEKKGIKRFCEDFNISIPIEERDLCPFCLIHEIITLLNPNISYIAYTKRVCKACAIQELEIDFKSKNINLLSSPGFKKYTLSILDRLKDVQKVVIALTNGKVSLGESTLVQKIEKVPDNEIRPFYKQIYEFSFSKLLLESLESRNINILLPIQVKSIQGGLLKKKNQLIIANTSAGKTLIGELAGISSLEKYKKKFIFAVPLVALANTKYNDFKKLYNHRFNIGLRTGKSRIFDSIEEKEQFYQDRYSIEDADIIVATYEGLDLLIRSGKINFDSIGCIVIDEIQTLADPDRGPTLDCLLAKIRVFANDVQVLALSATVGNSKQFADDLSLNLIAFNQRPIPLELHMIISRSEYEKMSQISKLILKENQLVSTNGFKGQTIVFTNSRRKTAEITESLRHSGITKARSYHSGLSYMLRRRIELEFTNGICPVVVSTYALGAGVDFPASQVIFESLMMGNKVLEPNNFTQMVGRAGRLGKHDRGRIILLCLGESISAIDPRTEVEIAFQLINSDLQPIEPNYDENSCAEQILSMCSTQSHIQPKIVKKIYERMIGTNNFDFMDVANKLIKNSFLKIISQNNKRFLQLTPIGNAATLSFFPPQKVRNIMSLLQHKKHFLSIALEMNPPQNIYLTKKLHNYLEKTFHMRFSTRLINSPVLDVMNASLNGKEATELNKWCLTIFSKWTQNFFNCDCSENPFCIHGQINIGRYIVNERLNGKNINLISANLSNFELLVYPGDVLSFLNGLIHELEGTQRISQAIEMFSIDKKIDILIDKIEDPKNPKNEKRN